MDTEYAIERKVSVPVDCGPCQKKVCPLDEPLHHQCMTGVTVEMVAEAAAELLAVRRSEEKIERCTLRSASG